MTGPDTPTPNESEPYVPERGDAVWLTFAPTEGREQAGRRPALVLSPAAYNGRTGLMLACPITSRAKGYPVEGRRRRRGGADRTVHARSDRRRRARGHEASAVCMRSLEATGSLATGVDPERGC